MNSGLTFFVLSAVVISGGCAGSGMRSKSEDTLTSNRTVAAASEANSKREETTAAASPEPAVNASSNPMFARRNQKLEALREQASEQTRQPVDIEAILKQSSRPAPENSEFSVALADVLVERRTFSNHPVLAKIEKVTEGPKKTIYVFTRDGGRSELPGDSIESISTVPSATVLRAIGKESPRSPVSSSKPNAAAKK